MQQLNNDPSVEYIFRKYGFVCDGDRSLLEVFNHYEHTNRKNNNNLQTE